MNLLRLLAGSAVLAVTLTSCVAPSKKPAEVDANGKKIEYVWYTPTGSNVPIRVPKDSLKLSDEEAAAQEKDLTDLQRNAPIVPPPSPGGK
jgi:ABC-type phosphate/phosphonate transport system substrate-binding protein